MNLNTVLGAMGLDPQKVMGDFDNIGKLVVSFDQRLKSIEEKQDRILSLLSQNEDPAYTLVRS